MREQNWLKYLNPFPVQYSMNQLCTYCFGPVQEEVVYALDCTVQENVHYLITYHHPLILSQTEFI